MLFPVVRPVTDGKQLSVTFDKICAEHFNGLL